MKKLIIFILFLVFTVVAVGFIGVGSTGIGLATNINMNLKADTDVASADALAYYDNLDNATSITVIDTGIVKNFLPAYAQIVIVHSANGSYTYIIGANDAFMLNQKEAMGIDAYNGTTKLNIEATYVSFGKILLWLAALLTIILLPTKRSRKNVKRIAEGVCEDMIEEEPAPKKKSKSSKGGKKKHRDYDDEDYDD